MSRDALRKSIEVHKDGIRFLQQQIRRRKEWTRAIENGYLTIKIPLTNPPVPSATGKTLVVADYKAIQQFRREVRDLKRQARERWALRPGPGSAAPDPECSNTPKGDSLWKSKRPTATFRPP